MKLLTTDLYRTVMVTEVSDFIFPFINASCDLRVLPGRDFCDGLITRSEESCLV
jgi:hypothetical protein